MKSRKCAAWALTMFLVLGLVLPPVQSGVILKKIKEKVKNIKNYFTGDCENEEERSNLEASTSTSTSTTTTTTTSTEYPRIDIRGQFDSDDVVGAENDGLVATNRQLIRLADNCPEGYKLARDRTCRKNV